jgi:hypothetical protein
MDHKNVCESPLHDPKTFKTEYGLRMHRKFVHKERRINLKRKR